MTTPPSSMTAHDPEPPAPPPPPPTPVPPSRLHWLETELARWVAAGEVSPSAAAAIRARYTPATRVALLRIVVGLGAAFLAVGLLWLVATNLDRLAPLVRFGAVAVIWLSLAVLAEALTARAGRVAPTPLRGDGSDAEGGAAPTVASVCRLLAAAAFGAVIFQAAQSLQVPAYEPRLVGVWALGSLLYAYATASRGALAVGLAAGLGWLAWWTAQVATGPAVVTVLVLSAATLATSVAAGHVPRWAAARPGFAAQWRVVGAALALVGLFIAALPFGHVGQAPWPAELTIALVVAGVAALASLAVLMRAGLGPAGRGLPWRDRAGEVVAAVLLLGLGGAFASWQPAGTLDDVRTGTASLEAWTHTGAGLLLFVAAAAWYATLGARREAPPVTAVALVGLVVFTTVQSFAVFAPLVSGATLFLGVGAVMVVTGLFADRIRRVLRRDRSRPGPTGGRTAPPPRPDETPTEAPS